MIRTFSRARRAGGPRRTALNVVLLEARVALSSTQTIPLPLAATDLAGRVARPMFEVRPFGGNGPGGGYTPAQVDAAYGFNRVSFNGVAGDGTGQTIAIVDAYHNPNIASDLAAFSSRFGLPQGQFSVVDQNGGTSYPAQDSTGGWEMEEALDVE